MRHPAGGVVLVTGAGRGIGAATAVELAARGHRVIVNYRRDTAAAEQVVTAIREAGGSAEAERADVTDREAVAALVERVEGHSGGIGGLVVNANTVPPPLSGLADLAWSDFRDKVTGELAGAFHVTQAVVATMRRRGAGRLVFLGSTAADYVGGGRLAHGTAKAALRVFARQVAAETARDGIGVLTVVPDAVRTDAVADLLDPASETALARDSLLGRMLEPADVARVVALAFDPALAVATGSTLTVDAGRAVLAGGPH